MRCVFLPLQLEADRLRQYREANDSLAQICPPHVTIVFPSDEPADVDEWLTATEDAAKRFGPLTIEFDSRAVRRDDTVQLVVARGSSLLTRLHALLTERIGTPSHIAYVPHVTIGRGSNLVLPSWLESVAPQPQRLCQIVVEEIGPNDESWVRGEFELVGQ